MASEGNSSKNKSKEEEGKQKECGQIVIPHEQKNTVNDIRIAVGVKFTESEIYNVLCECRMDAKVAVRKLLSQVKSKRERKKEIKERQELRSYDSVNVSCGVKAGTGFGTEDPKLREDGSISQSITSSSMASDAATQSTKEQPPSQSDTLNADRRSQTVGTGATYFSEQTSGESQVATVGSLSGQVSVADAVKMGQLHSKGSHMTVDASCTLQDIETPDSYFHMKSSYDSLLSSKGIYQDLEGQRRTNVSEIIQQSGDINSQQHYEHEWPAMKQQTAVNRSSALNIPTASDVGLLTHHSYSLGDGTKLYKNCQSKDVQVSQSNVDSYIVESNSPSSQLQTSDDHPSTANVRHQDFPEVVQPESSRRNINEFYSHGHDFNPLKSLSTFSSKNIQEPNSPPTHVMGPEDRDFTQDSQPINFPSDEEIIAPITEDLDGLNSSFAEVPLLPSKHGDTLCGVNSTTPMDKQPKSLEQIFAPTSRDGLSSSFGVNSTNPMNKIANFGFFSGMSLAPGHAPPQNLSAHHLSSNLTAFPTDPQPYIHSRFALNQAYQDSSTYNDPSEGMTYTYQHGYGHVRNPTNFARSFLNSLPTTPNAAAAGYDGRLNVQHVGTNIAMHQQNDGFSSRGHVPGLRALPPVPDNRYNLLGHGQLLSTPQEGQSLMQYQHDQLHPTYQQHAQYHPTHFQQPGQYHPTHFQQRGQYHPTHSQQRGQYHPTHHQQRGQYHPTHHQQHSQPYPTDHLQRTSHYPFQQQQQQSQGYGALGSTDVDNSQQSSNDPPNVDYGNFQG